MDYLQNKRSPIRRFGGLGIVVMLHGLLVYAVITDLAGRAIDIIRQPVETKIIEEIKPPPPDVAPPPPPPHMAAPPPPYMPIPEVRIQQPPSPNAITSVTNVPLPIQTYAKTVVPAAPEPIVAPAPVSVATPPPVPAFLDLNACKPSYPHASLMAEEQGTVRVQFTIGTAGQLVDTKVLKSSGYKNLDKATVSGLSLCKFRPAYKDGKPVQSSFMSDYVWKMDE